MVELAIRLDKDDYSAWVQACHVSIHCATDVVDQVHWKYSVCLDAEHCSIGRAWISIRVCGVQGVVGSYDKVFNATWNYWDSVQALTWNDTDSSNIVDQCGCCDQEEA